MVEEREGVVLGSMYFWLPLNGLIGGGGGGGGTMLIKDHDLILFSRYKRFKMSKKCSEERLTLNELKL